MTGKEFSDLRKTLGLNQTKLGETIGFKMRTVQDWEKMDIVPIYAEKLIHTIGDNDSQMIKEEKVPFYENDVTGSITGSFSDIKESPSFYVDFKPFNDCVAYFTIYGDSMYPRFASGEIIAVKEIPNKETIQWGEAHLVITDASENNMRTVKTIHPYDKDDSCVVLRASNPNFKGDTVIKKKAIINMYLVKGKVQRIHI